jgi:two-component system LytT family response regulator
MFTFGKKSELNMLRTIIIDDEAHMRQTLEKMVGRFCPNIKLLATADGVQSGVEKIRKHHPDLILLDIKMKDGTGFDLLKQLHPVDFKVIFITAYDQYAIKAFKFSAIDYILKPVDPDELAEAVRKAEETKQKDFSTQLANLEEQIHTQDKANKKIILKTLDNIHLIKIRNINYCESEGSYCAIHLLNGKKILVSNILKDYDELLKDAGFYRVHKSYLINMRHIERFEKTDGGYVVLENEIKVPVASRKREELMEMFERLAEI